MAQDQMFTQMKLAAVSRLANRNPIEIARNAGICYDVASQEFRFTTLGNNVIVHYPSYDITPALSGWHTLVILHYLDLADGHPLEGREIPFGGMKSGMVRGGGIDHKCEDTIQRAPYFGEIQLEKVCASMGGVRISTNADVAYHIPFLPRFPVALKVWMADEEFPASGRLLLDASADHYLTIEDAVTVAEIIIGILADGLTEGGSADGKKQ